MNISGLFLGVMLFAVALGIVKYFVRKHIEREAEEAGAMGRGG